MVVVASGVLFPRESDQDGLYELYRRSGVFGEGVSLCTVAVVTS